MLNPAELPSGLGLIPGLGSDRTDLGGISRHPRRFLDSGFGLFGDIEAGGPGARIVGMCWQLRA